MHKKEILVVHIPIINNYYIDFKYYQKEIVTFSKKEHPVSVTKATRPLIDDVLLQPVIRRDTL